MKIRFQKLITYCNVFISFIFYDPCNVNNLFNTFLLTDLTRLLFLCYSIAFNCPLAISVYSNNVNC